MNSELMHDLRESDWKRLLDLRNVFLSEDVVRQENYWASRELLELYHCTFAQRIGWKWDAVLKEIAAKNIFEKGKKYSLLDFGCGTGIASHKFLQHFGSGGVSEVLLWDVSKQAVEFASSALKKDHQQLEIKILDELKVPEKGVVVCLSHVINELKSEELEDILALLEKAEVVIWVEPGTSACSLQLIKVREILRSRFALVSPCNHSNPCGMLGPGNEHHWCHFFASPPTTVFQSAFWTKFSRVLKIDLRSLPVSYLVFSNRKESIKNDETIGRVIGRPRFYKGQGKFLMCMKEAVRETTLLERSHKGLFKAFKKDRFSKSLNLKDSK